MSIIKNSGHNTDFLEPTSELSAINIMLSGIGEAPVNSLDEITTDVAIARNTLNAVSKEVQTEGWQWNTEDNYPLVPNTEGFITLHPSVIRVHFREPDDKELVIRGNRVYDRVNHTYKFKPETHLEVTITVLLPFESLPEACRDYVTLKALRIFQERVVGSQVLSQFQMADEARARAIMKAEERREDRPNILKGTLPPTGTYRVATVLMNRSYNRGILNG